MGRGQAGGWGAHMKKGRCVQCGSQCGSGTFGPCESANRELLWLLQAELCGSWHQGRSVLLHLWEAGTRIFGLFPKPKKPFSPPEPLAL